MWVWAINRRASRLLGETNGFPKQHQGVDIEETKGSQANFCHTNSVTILPQHTEPWNQTWQ